VPLFAAHRRNRLCVAIQPLAGRKKVPRPCSKSHMQQSTHPPQQTAPALPPTHPPHLIFFFRDSMSSTSSSRLLLNSR
jgi:hypothetical protein